MVSKVYKKKMKNPNYQILKINKYSKLHLLILSHFRCNFFHTLEFIMKCIQKPTIPNHLSCSLYYFHVMKIVLNRIKKVNY